MIKSLHLRGLQSHTDSTVEFTPGVNVILGETNAGKTAIVRALQWIFQNRPLGVGLTQKGAKECVAEVKTDRGSASRVRRKGFNGYVVGGVEYKEIGSSVPEELTKVVDLRDVNLQEQLQPHFLITQPAGQISKYISELLGFNVTDKMISAVKSKSSSLKGERSSLLDEIELAESEIARYGEIDRVDLILSNVESLEKKKQSVSSSVSKLSSIILSMESMEAELGGLRSKALPLAERVQSASLVIDGLDSKYFEYSTQATKIKDIGSSLIKIDSAREYMSSRLVGLPDIDELINISYDDLSTLYKYVNSISGVHSSLETIHSLNDQIVSAKSQNSALDINISKVKSEYVAVLEESGSCPLCFGDIDPKMVSILIEGAFS